MKDGDLLKAETSAEEAYAKALEAAVPAMEIPAVKPAVKPKAAATEPTLDKPIKNPDIKPQAAAPKPQAAAPKPQAAAPKPQAAAPKAKPKAAKKVVATVAAPKISKAPSNPAFAKTKEKPMTIKDNLTKGVETMLSEAQAKAKEAFEKSTAMFGDYAEFAKGNVEAVVESGKILAEGLQDMGTNLVAEGRSSFEAISSDLKGMAAAKSPTDLIQLQSEMFRKGFDNAVAYGSKNTEALIKLAGEVITPISGRVSLAVEKVRQSAA